MLKIHWTKCLSYDEAKNFHGVVYVHVWNQKPFYWGKAHHSIFGGNPRKNDEGAKMNPRYNAGYRHWIEGCLRNGGELYVGKLDNQNLDSIDEVENYLIEKFGTEMTQRSAPIKNELNLSHTGDVPVFIK